MRTASSRYYPGARGRLTVPKANTPQQERDLAVAFWFRLLAQSIKHGHPIEAYRRTVFLAQAARGWVGRGK